MANNVIEFNAVQHIYDIEICSGCECVITGEYVEIGLLSQNGSEIRHIALCDSCGELAENAGVWGG